MSEIQEEIEYFETEVKTVVKHRWQVGDRVAANVRVRVIDGIYMSPAFGPSYFGHFEDDRTPWTTDITRADQAWYKVN